VNEVARAIGTDSRIGGKFLQASVGFGGSCFQKDILNLVYLCEAFGLGEVGAYWEQVIKMNDLRKATFVKNIIECLFNTVDNKKIAILGFAFKKDTSDTRETPAIAICDGLLKDGAILHIYDPKVSKEQALIEFSDHALQIPDERQFVFSKSASEAVEKAHAIVVLTEWDEFKTLDFQSFYAKMEKPAFVFDGRNILNHKFLFGLGFEVHRIGSPPLQIRRS
jgi:UDPglucose 6-dehydrogenase